MTDNPIELAGLKEIPASEILAKIEKGEPVEYDHVIIVGDLNLSNLRLPQKDDKKLVASQIRITESAIKGILDFRNAIFQKLIDFSKTELYQEVNFERATFESGAWFSGARFEKDAVFEKVAYVIG